MRFISVLLIFITTSLSANKKAYVSWVADDDMSIYRLNLDTGVLDMFSDDSVVKIGQFKRNYSSEELFSGEHGQLHSVKGRWLVSFSGSGQVFELSFQDSSISRIDGTYQHGYNFDAYQFERQGRIYSFGGYGFWMENNMLNRFDESAREWFHVSEAPYPIEVDEQSGIRHLRWYDKREDVLYVSHFRTLYAYSFSNDKWIPKGRLQKDLYTSGITNFNIINDSLGLAYNKSGYWLLDWRKNELHKLDLSANQEISAQSGLDGIHCMYMKDQEMLVLRKTDKVKAGFFLTVLVPSNWKTWETTRLYTPYSWYKILFYTMCSLVLAIFVWIIRYRYLKVIRKKSDWLEFLTIEDRSLYNALLRSDLDTDEVNTILNLQELGWEVQRRKRSEAIKSINAFSNKALGFDIIERHKSEKDKRQVIYRLNSRLK